MKYTAKTLQKKQDLIENIIISMSRTRQYKGGERMSDQEKEGMRSQYMAQPLTKLNVIYDKVADEEWEACKPIRTSNITREGNLPLI